MRFQRVIIVLMERQRTSAVHLMLPLNRVPPTTTGREIRRRKMFHHYCFKL
ncbi:hypothetical protein MAR_000427 [Mya arenaria]|uniref:Uncharacterized protein n=1 Tax=Mya arenaria TaxID=6604 RepID=A0ABY7FCQ4_MYAAR|nr:hypothetical protein MAR_000427 [Mya arenaria]